MKISILKNFFNKTNHIKESERHYIKENHQDVFEKKTNVKKIKIKRNIFYKKTIEYNGLDNGYIYKKIFNKNTHKINKIKFEVGVGKSQDGEITTYHFFDKNTLKEIGYINILDWKKIKNKNINIYNLLKNTDLEKDYPQYGIIGDRISIDYLKNNFYDDYSGIGELADQVALEYCLKENIPPQIVSMAQKGSVIAHYKRGRRFMQLESEEKKEFIKEFGTDDPNKIIEERLKEYPNFDRINCNDIGYLYMYMPKEIVEKYLKRIKENPILH